MSLDGSLYLHHDTTGRLEKLSYPVMLATGLEDCELNPIYEDDIVQVTRPNSYLEGVYQVKWHVMGIWAYYSPHRKNAWCDGFALKGNQQPYLIKQKNAKIIGNIHENPELLTSPAHSPVIRRLC